MVKNLTRKLAETIVDDVLGWDPGSKSAIVDSVEATIRMHSAPMPDDGVPASLTVAFALVQTEIESLAALAKTVARTGGNVVLAYTGGNGINVRWRAELGGGSLQQTAATISAAVATLRRELAAEGQTQLARKRRELAELAEALGVEPRGPDGVVFEPTR